jgi:hypothetical protein
MPAKKNNHNGSKRIDAVRHKDKRKNIPTEELRDFVRDDENAPKKLLYPRDPDLDPQLVWKGKDEQDAAKPAKVAAARNLWVPAVNNAGTWDRWAFVEIADPWDAKGTICAWAQSAQKETPAPAPPRRAGEEGSGQQ